ncbi:MAG: helix-turn-helix domain-containing protein [Acidimicrobiales bacterium]
MATELLSGPSELDLATSAPAIDVGLDHVGFDEDGLLRIGRRWVAFPAVEQRLVEVLVEHAGHLVRREALAEAAWPGRPVDDDLLYLRIGRARRRIEPYGLTIVAVRGRGYVLDQRTA